MGHNRSPYQYLQPAFANRGFAFQDAFSLLNYRYYGNPLLGFHTVSKLRIGACKRPG